MEKNKIPQEDSKKSLGNDKLGKVSGGRPQSSTACVSNTVCSTKSIGADELGKVSGGRRTGGSTACVSNTVCSTKSIEKD